MLSVMGPERVARCLSSGDAKSLTKIPGIGAKSADRLVLELRDKVGPHAGPGHAGRAPRRTKHPAIGARPVTEALVGLGWNAKQAESAVERRSPRR
jgi:Holliday junction DNA helicase RuvA